MSKANIEKESELAPIDDDDVEGFIKAKEKEGVKFIKVGFNKKKNDKLLEDKVAECEKSYHYKEIYESVRENVNSHNNLLLLAMNEDDAEAKKGMKLPNAETMRNNQYMYLLNYAGELIEK